jgi:NADPH:quinone reductase-like Zn-dependent oxidoreductase
LAIFFKQRPDTKQLPRNKLTMPAPPNMRALVLERYGAPFTLREVAVPTVGPGQVRVRIMASGVNPLDTKIKEGQGAHARVELPAILGIDLAGVVECVAPDVTAFSPGDEVYGMAGGVGGLQGSLAMFAAVDAHLLALKPKNLSMREAAALPLALITAWEGLVDRAQVRAGQKVLIHAGAGGVGHIAVQLARALGAQVFATVSKDKVKIAEGYGATAIDYRTENVELYVAKHTNAEGFDIVYDTVGGATLDDSFIAVKTHSGHVVSCLGWGTHELAPLSFRGATYSGVFTLLPMLTGRGRLHHGDILREGTKLAETGALTPLLCQQRFTFETVLEAYAAVELGKTVGKVVVEIPDLMKSSEENQISVTTPNALTRSGQIIRFMVIGAMIAGIAGLFLYAGGWFTPHALSPATMINTFERVNGERPGFRRNHAKGVCVSGYFESNGRGAALSKAVVFLPGRVPIVGRFGFSGGNPYIADNPTTVRSLAILFKLPDGEEWRTAMINIPVFVVNTAQGFYDQLLASAPDPATGKPDPAKMSAFSAKHPEFVKALQLIHSQPGTSGFADSSYNSLNAFRFINAQGRVVPVRWSTVPVEPLAPMNTSNAGSAATNYLFNALIASIHAKPVQWHLVITVGQPSDPTDDATLPWPPDREQVEVGMLTIDRVESEDTSPVRDINFDPLILPNGIAASDDPLLSARSAAYSQSFTRREGEHKDPSAVSAAETRR